MSRKIDPETIRAIPGDKIFFIQLADAPLIDMDLLYWSRHFRNMPGEGDLDVAGFMRAVAATGYNGVLSLEIFNDQFRSGSPKSFAVDGYRALLCLMDEVKRLEPSIKLDVPEMPDRIDVSGMEFIEFAADEAEAERRGEMLTTLGFRRCGRHISKDVNWWKQGDINIVINTDREGFAHASDLVHGTGVCDIGLRVEDAAATVARARALGARPFQQSIGPGELEIPAIQGVGGGVVHFIDDKSELSKVWEIEFRKFDGAEGAGAGEAGLRRIDHVAQTMNYEEMLTWLLFYTSIFKTEKSAMVDVVDPAGLVRSQAVASGDGEFRITLNGAENHRTLAGHFITESFGSAVQHVAFATDDIFASAAALTANGFSPLVISPNYYDDLEARLGLEADFVEKLRAQNILYDRDGDGEFFQLYSPNYGEGFFFEIVERRGGYAGYGAVNAQFRIAAQKRAIRPVGLPRM